MHPCMRRWPLLLLAASCLVATPAAAQNYPSRVIKLVVPFAAGGQPDTIARLFAQHLSVTVGPTIIDNHPGANTTIGTALVAKADPDGYTLL
jgi:tripartite-type tricarboxylate transporter receptor subunit TctC